MWTFESKNGSDSPQFLKHKDVFAQYILPRMREPKVEWDNECEDEQGVFQTVKDCEAKCDGMRDCLQYSYNNLTKMCRTSTVPRLGHARAGMQSGWRLKRIEKYAAALPPCGEEGWIIELDCTHRYG